MKNELDIRLLSVIGLNSFAGHNSSARQYMFNSHIGQALVVKGSTPKRIQTGLEQELGKFTFNVKMPCRGSIVAVIDKYRVNSLTENFRENPSSYIIFENLENGEIDYLEIPRYKSFHYMFGYSLIINKDVYNKLRPGVILEKDTVISDSESIDEVGNYKFGTELNVAMMSHPAVAEDGFAICEDVLDRLIFTKYEKRSFEFGENYFPLNLYGDENHYKPFPDIGEYVREDAILGALRPYREGLSSAFMSVTDTMTLDYAFDKMTYATSPKSQVVDIKIFHNVGNRYQLPDKMRYQLDKYAMATDEFYKSILDVERRLRQRNRQMYNSDKLSLSPRFHRLVVESLIMTEHGKPTAADSISKVSRNKPIDTYIVDFVLATETMPDIGYKLSGLAGDKGVIVSILKSEEMPMDKDGLRADVICDDISTIKRMNYSRLYEQYISRVCLHIKFKLRDYIGMNRHEPHGPHAISKYLKKNLSLESSEQFYEFAKTLLLEFYNIILTKIKNHFLGLNSDEWIEHVLYVTAYGPYLYITPNHDKSAKQIVKDLFATYRVSKDVVTMKSPDGEMITTKEPVLIGPLYMLLLEKTGDSWSATSSARYQHFGIIATSKADKYAYPYKNSAVRSIGETESRVYASYTSPLAIAEMINRSNSSVAHRAVVDSIMKADNPSDIKCAIDRNVVSFGGSKPLQYVKHLLYASGLQILYQDMGEYRPNE